MARLLHLFNILGARTEAMWLTYATRLAERGHDVTCGYESLGDVGAHSALRRMCIPRVEVGATDDVDAPMNALAASPPSSVLATLVDEGFELIHGHGGTRVLHASPWIARGVPVVISLYGYDASRLLRDPCWVARYRWAAEHGTTFVVLHDSMGASLIERGIPSKHVRTIKLGIDLSEWACPDDELTLDAEPRFVFVGRLVEKKAPGVAVDAVARLRAQFGVTARLDIVGDGPLRGDLEAQVAALGLGDSVTMHGALERDGVASVLRGASGLVLPSVEASDGDCEGTPVVLMEAQAMGVPCLTTRHSGNADVVAPAMRSFVIDRADADALASSMSRLLSCSDDERRSLGMAGRAWVESEFDIDRTAANYDALYAMLCSRGRDAIRV